MPVLLIIALASIRQINKPISEMTKVAIELTNGNYSVRANENVHGEIGIFARAMNRMSDTISQTIYQLDSEKRQLWYILSSLTAFYKLILQETTLGIVLQIVLDICSRRTHNINVNRQSV